MTLLDKRKLQEGFHFNVHEAPYNLSNAWQRQDWINQGKPCFDRLLTGLWKVYCDPLSPEDCYLHSVEAERDERRRFIRYPLMTLTEDLGDRTDVKGGAWTDNISSNKQGICATFHLVVMREYRHQADGFFREYLREMHGSYEYLCVEWGKRDKDDDPSRFFARWGFVIEDKTFNKSAIVRLEDIRDRYLE